MDVADYPAEDTEVRAQAYNLQPGGNATNTATILAQAGHQLELVAVVAAGAAGDYLLQRVAAQGVGVSHCVRQAGQSPTSLILRSQITGSRTIVHHRDLPELTTEDWNPEALATCDWLHFEGRNPEHLPTLLRRLRRVIVDQPVSLELEKPRQGLEQALNLADVLMYSRTWVSALHPDLTPEVFMEHCAQQRTEHIQTLTWGSQGAWLATRGAVVHAPATPNLVVKDSIGAGDSFNAGLIHALVSGQPPQRALQEAVRVAERKLGQQGLGGKLIQSI